MTRDETVGGACRSWWARGQVAVGGALIFAVAMGCSDDGPTDPDPDEEPGPDPEPDVGQVVVSPEEVAFASLGVTRELEVEVLDSDGDEMDDATVSWSSDEEDVATVDDNGVVTAEGNGEAAITAAVNGEEGTVEVEVEQEVASVGVTPDEVEFEAIGESRDLAATAVDAEGHTVHYRQTGFTWISSDEAVAEVDGAGTVTAVGGGTASVQAGVDGVSSNAAAVQVQTLATRQVAREITLGTNDYRSDTLACDPGEVALSGGARSGYHTLATGEAGPAGSEDSWVIVMVNPNPIVEGQATLAVICADPGGLELQRVTESFQLPGDGNVREFTQCPAGTVALGGGVTIPDIDGYRIRLRESAPVGGMEDGWIASISQTDGTEETVEITAFCGDPPSGYERVTTDITVPEGEMDDEVQEVQCPAGKRVLSGGARVVGAGSREFDLQTPISGPLEPEGDHEGWGTRLRNFDGQDLTIQRSAVCAD